MPGQKSINETFLVRPVSVCVCVCVQLSAPWISVMNGPWAAESLLQDQAKFSGLVLAKKSQNDC